MNLLNRNNALALSICALLGSMPASFAESYQGSVSRTKVQSGTYLQHHPVVKRTAIGAGVGAGAGALTGLVTGKGAMRGALIGTGTGAGVGLIRSSKTLKRHPVAKQVATGTAVGLGLGLAANRGHGAGRRVAATTGIGAAIGLGAGLLRDEFR